MKKVMIIGCCGAGKSTFARKLHSKTGIGLIHLDQEYWHPGWVETNKIDWERKMKNLISGNSWIIDGNYSGTLDIRLEAADTVFYLDFPTWVCMWRVFKRTYKYFGKTRPDMVEGCKERISLPFLHHVLFFNITRKKRILEKLQALKNQKEIFTFSTDGDIEDYLNKLN